MNDSLLERMYLEELGISGNALFYPQIEEIEEEEGLFRLAVLNTVESSSARIEIENAVVGLNSAHEMQGFLRVLKKGLSLLQS